MDHPLGRSAGKRSFLSPGTVCMHTEDVFTNLLLFMNNDIENKYCISIQCTRTDCMHIHPLNSSSLEPVLYWELNHIVNIVYLCFQNYLAFDYLSTTCSLEHFCLKKQRCIGRSLLILLMLQQKIKTTTSLGIA